LEVDRLIERKLMKAMVYTEYGPPEFLRLAEVEKPAPRNDEILAKVRATTVSAGVLWARTGKQPDSKLFTLALRLMFGLNKPRKTILGYEFSGEVEAVGKDVSLFERGDRVFGTTTGLRAGAYAEYVCLPERWKQGVVTGKPVNETFEQAAAVPVEGMAALDLLERANVQSVQKVIIYGASGSVGAYAVQIAKHYYGAEVTGVCSSSNLDLVKSLGAGKVTDYSREDFTRNGETYDVIFDAVGKISPAYSKGALKKDGKYLTVKSPTGEKTENLLLLKELIEAGKIRAVIDRCYPLEQAAEAHRYVEKGHKKGNVVITIGMGID
jgi:NADPH:quinone reductase-like Zn-dependent oxidoreductase